MLVNGTTLIDVLLDPARRKVTTNVTNYAIKKLKKTFLKIDRKAGNNGVLVYLGLF
jgi:hypothetical protein